MWDSVGVNSNMKDTREVGVTSDLDCGSHHRGRTWLNDGRNKTACQEGVVTGEVTLFHMIIPMCLGY